MQYKVNYWCRLIHAFAVYEPKHPIIQEVDGMYDVNIYLIYLLYKLEVIYQYKNILQATYTLGNNYTARDYC